MLLCLSRARWSVLLPASAMLLLSAFSSAQLQAAQIQPTSSSANCTCAPAAKAHDSAEDLRLRTIYTADAAWRKAQLQDDDEDEAPGSHVRPHLPHEDPATQAERLAHWMAVLQQLDAIHPAALSGTEHVNFEVLHAQVISLRNAQQFREYEKPANSDSAFWSDQAGPGREPFRSAQDYSNYISRMNDLPRYFREQIANMRSGLARGFTPPRVTLEGRESSLVSITTAASPEANPYFRPFLKMPASIPANEQATLRESAKAALRASVVPAYAELLQFWHNDYVPRAQTALAATALPNGAAYYQSQILEYTTTTLTPAEIHKIGLDEMAGIHAEMLAAMKASGFTGDLPAFLTFLRTDPQFYAKTPDELLMRVASISKEFDGVAARFFGYLPRQRFAIRPVPADRAPFYTSARGGPGTYLVNTYDLPSRGLYSLPALTLHESAPGHAFQIPIATEVAREQHLPDFRKAYISAYGEGWALYCERLGTEMGSYHTPYETFGMLSYQAWRAARLVVDTGVHAQGWTREQAQAYLRENTALSDHEIETEVDRYISWPGQALSYYLGEMAIMKARHKAEAALGAKFNLRAFHDTVLVLGSVPLFVIEEQVDAMIARGGTGPYPEMER